MAENRRKKLEPVDLVGIADLLEHLVSTDTITREERDKIIQQITKDNNLIEHMDSLTLVWHFIGECTVALDSTANPYCSNSKRGIRNGTKEKLFSFPSCFFLNFLVTCLYKYIAISYVNRSNAPFFSVNSQNMLQK